MKIKGRWRFIVVAVLAVSFAGMVGGCGPAPPVIVDFSCSPTEISAGESATLSWVVSGATKVSIDKGVGMVDAVGTKEVSPSKTTTYTLLAINSGVVVSSSVVVTVGAASSPSPDTTAPVVTNLAASSITAASAVVTWTTDEPATSQVEYGTTGSYGSTTTLDGELVTSHSVSLTGIEVDTTYHFRVKSEDASGNEATSGTDQTFTTPAEADATRPVISGVDVSNISESGATITWTTDEPATSQVEYGTTTSYGSTSALDDELTTSHSVTLIGLELDTSYHFAVKSEDAAGNEAASMEVTFTTSSEADTTPPAISGVDASNISESGATISWTTDEPATSQVEYGTTTAYGSASALDEALVTSHSAALTGLESGTTHHLRVKSEDATGNKAVSGDYTFVTAEVATEVGGIISSDTTWTKEDSPYLVTSNILVPSGVTLTIEPGVTVKFGDHPVLPGTLYIQVEGKLIAQGTTHEEIVFCPSDPDSWPDYATCWHVTMLDDGEGVIEYCVLERGVINIYSTSTSIKNSFVDSHIQIGGEGDAQIIDNHMRSITFQGGSAYLSGNEIFGDVWVNEGSATITKNDLIGAQARIAIGTFAETVTITYNNIVGCRGIEFSESGACVLTVEYNNLYDNEPFSVMAGPPNENLDFPNNWWGTTDTLVIDAAIYDHNDDFNLATVSYEPIATSEIPNAGVQ